MARVTYQINTRVLMAQLAASSPVIKPVMDQVAREAFFMPAVAQLKKDFETHKVTQEIAMGADGTNISNTLKGAYASTDTSVPPNLFGFIGFNMTPWEVLDPIVERLDPSHPSGPKLIYKRAAKTHLQFQYEIRAPSEQAIYNDKRTGLFWLPGISWVKRIEQGIPGVTHFLNEPRPESRSGGGIQVQGNVRTGGRGEARFRPVPYLSQMFNNFLRNVVGRKPTGRSPLG